MMWWLPSFDNGIVAAIFAFVFAMVGWYVKVMLPAWKRNHEAKALKTEKESELADALPLILNRQTDLMGRSVAMLNDHGMKLDGHGAKLTEHSFLLREIRRQVSRDSCDAGKPDGPDTGEDRA